MTADIGPDFGARSCPPTPRDDTARPRVFVDDRFVCDTTPLDRVRNATRTRRRITGDPAPLAEASHLDPLGLIEAEHYDRVRPVGAPTQTAIVGPDVRWRDDDPDSTED